MKPIATVLLLVSVSALSSCDWIGDPWVEDPQRLEEERSRTDKMNDRLIDRAERAYADR